LASSKEKIFFQYTKFNSFVKRDAEILAEKYDLQYLGFNLQKKWQLPFFLFLQLFTVPIKLFKTKGTLIYFGGYHSLIPVIWAKIFKVKSVIIVGGTDAVSFPEINYGNFRKPILAWFTKKSYQWCSIIAPVHKTLAFTDYQYFNKSKQGVLAYVPSVHPKIKAINNGYRPWLWSRLNRTRKPKSFLTVSLTLGYAYFKRKGIDLILEAAKNFPECSFTIVGADNPEIMKLAPPNVSWLAPVPLEELNEIYNQHQFYLQLSICEGLPNSLCEAMLCGCVPIGSSAMSIPEIIGDAGFVVAKRDLNLLYNTIYQALSSDIENLSEKATNRIITNYHFDKRKFELLEVFG
jgi:glycosyltransferase involved in cell wall biosynthesis